MKEFSRREFLPLAGLTILGTSCLSVKSDDKQEESILIKPKALKKGAIIGICAPAGCIEEGSEIQKFVDKLHSFGFETRLGKNLSGRYGYFSANDKERAEEFMSMISDNSVDGIFFIRGGWGSARILPYLDFDLIKANPKVIMGFSDITTLLNAITNKSGLVTFHGPGGNSTWNDYTMNYFDKLIKEGRAVNYRNGEDDKPTITLSSGRAKGELFGGNLSVICSLIGSGYLPDWKGKILFLEDVKEEPYRIDRMLTQLKQCGILDEVEGVVLGVFRDCVAEDPERAFTLEEVLQQHFSGSPKPVYYGAQFGHVRNKYILPVGVKLEMDADKGIMTMIEKAVLS